MKKIALLISLLFIPSFVNAEFTCPDEELVQLQNQANEIKFIYEADERLLDPSEYVYPEHINTPEEQAEYQVYEDLLNVSILNLNENFIIEITNNKNGNVINASYNDLVDGKFVFEHEDFFSLYTYKMTVYLSEASNCGDDAIKVMYLETPVYNEFHSYSVCEEFKEEGVCQKFVTSENLSEVSFWNRINELQREEEGTNGETDGETEDNFVSKYSGFLLIGAAIIAVGAVVFVVINKRRKK